MGRELLHVFLVGLAALLIWLALPQSDRLSTYVDLVRAREAYARNPDAIHIAVVWPNDVSDPNSLMRGAEVAAAEVNRRRIPLTERNAIGEPSLDGLKVINPKTENGQPYCEGVPLKIELPSEDRRSVIKCTQIELTAIDTATNEEADKARELSADPRYVAVIGHSTSDIAKLASVRYQYTQLLFFGVNATDPSFTTHGFGFSFRNVPTDNEIAEALSKTLDPFGKDNIAILYSHSGHSRDTRSSHMVSAVDTYKAAGLRRQPRLEITVQKAYGSVLTPPAEASRTSYLKSFFTSRDVRFYERHMSGLREAINVAMHAKASTFLLLDDRPTRAKEVLRRIRSQASDKLVLTGPSLDTPDLFPDGEALRARVMRLPAATARVAFHTLRQPDKLPYIRDRARELNYVFADDFGQAISIAPEVAPRVLNRIWKQLETARLGQYEDLGVALSNGEIYAPDIKCVFSEHGVPPALGIYLSVLEPTLAACPLPTPRPRPTPPQLMSASPSATPAPTPARRAARPAATPPRSFNLRPTVTPTRAPGAPAPTDWCGTSKLGEAVTAAAVFMKGLREGVFSEETDAAKTLLALLSYKYGPQRYQTFIEDLKRPQAGPPGTPPRVLTPREREQRLWARLAPEGAQETPDNLDPEEYLWRLFAAAIIGENPADFGVALRALSFEGMQPGTTYVASVFSPQLLKVDGVRRFVEEYKRRNDDEEPDFTASQGYEAVSILAQAYTAKKTVMPTDISAALRLLGDFDGLMGKVSFSTNGDILKKPIFLKAYGAPGTNRFACGR